MHAHTHTHTHIHTARQHTHRDDWLWDGQGSCPPTSCQPGPAKQWPAQGHYRGWYPPVSDPTPLVANLCSHFVISKFLKLINSKPLDSGNHLRQTKMCDSCGVNYFAHTCAFSHAHTAVVLVAMETLHSNKYCKCLLLWKQSHAHCTFPRVTLDTPVNRKNMPNADFSQWTPLEFVAR